MRQLFDSLLIGIDLRSRRSRIDELDERLMADTGLTRRDLRLPPRRRG